MPVLKRLAIGLALALGFALVVLPNAPHGPIGQPVTLQAATWTLLSHTAVSGNSTSATTTAISTTGATLILVGVGDDVATAPTITDSASNTTWNLLTPQTASGGTIAGAKLFSIANPITSGSHTFTVASTFPSICVTAWSGTVGVYDERASNTQTSGGTLAPGSVTPTAPNALLFTVLGASQNDTLTINASYTISDQIGGSTAQRVGCGYLIQTSAAAANPTWTLSLGTLPSAAINTAFELGATAGGGGETSAVFAGAGGS